MKKERPLKTTHKTKDWTHRIRTKARECNYFISIHQKLGILLTVIRKSGIKFIRWQNVWFLIIWMSTNYYVEEILISKK